MSMPDLLMVAAAPVLALVLAIAVLVGKSRRRSRLTGLPGVPGVPPPGYPTGPVAQAGAFGAGPASGTGVERQVFPVGPRVELPPDLLAHVRSELFEGRKIQAIKLIRQHTGLGLKDAKGLADALESGAQVDGPMAPGAGASDFAPWSPMPADGSLIPADGSLSERVRAFKLAGDRASAVALVRSQTGMTADEAGRFVDALD